MTSNRRYVQAVIYNFNPHAHPRAKLVDPGENHALLIENLAIYILLVTRVSPHRETLRSTYKSIICVVRLLNVVQATYPRIAC